jgi:hypothetical protein
MAVFDLPFAVSVAVRRHRQQRRDCGRWLPSDDCPVGVDVEVIRPVPDVDAAVACLARAPQETCDGLSGLALAAAGAVHGAPPEVEWRSPLTGVPAVATPARIPMSHQGV